MIGRVYFNGSYVDASEALMSTISQAMLYGRGVFTTIRVADGKPFLSDKHWRRLAANASKLAVDVSEYSGVKCEATLQDLIARSGLTNGRVRATLLDGSEHPRWSSGLPRQKTHLLFIFSDQITSGNGLHLGGSEYTINTRSPLAGVKSCNYLEHLIAYEEAKRNGYDEAVRVNERGEITSGCMSNIFWLEGKELYTPSLSTGCLPGTTREYVIDQLGCREVTVSIGSLEHADAIFLTSAGLGVAAVAQYQGKQLFRTDHPILTLLPF